MERFEIIGRFLGYPKCCTDWFGKRRNGEVPFELTSLQKMVDENKGYIPCPACAKKCVMEELRPSDLIQDRICSTPYPKVDFEEMQEYVENYERTLKELRQRNVKKL